MDETDSEKYQDMSPEKFRTVVKKRFSSRNPASAVSKVADSDDFSDVYDFGHPRRGLAVIINNVNFNSTRLEDLVGYHHDETALKNSFGHLGFHVEAFEDLKARQIQVVAKGAATIYDHRDADCFVFVILTHGREIDRDGKNNTNIKKHVLWGVDGIVVETGKIVEWFRDIKSLIGKPRMFFIQACRGRKLDDGVTVQDLGNGEMVGVGAAKPPNPEPEGKGDKVTIRPVILYPDSLIMYGSPPGYEAWVNREEGSWFIQELCKVLDSEDIGSKSLLRGLTTVCRKVGLNHQSQTWDPEAEYVKTLSEEGKRKKIASHEKKCIPVVDTQLLKDVYMRRHE